MHNRRGRTERAHPDAEDLPLSPVRYSGPRSRPREREGVRESLARGHARRASGLARLAPTLALPRDGGRESDLSPWRGGNAGRPGAATVLAVFMVLLWAAGVAACAHQAPPVGSPGAPGASPASAPVSPGILPPPDAIPGTFAVRQKIVARSKHGNGGFEAVLQKQPG